MSAHAFNKKQTSLRMQYCQIMKQLSSDSGSVARIFHHVFQL